MMALLTVQRRMAGAILLFVLFAWSANAQGIDVAERLKGFDDYMAKTLKDWNARGVGVGIVVNDRLIFAKGYGFRDYEKKLAFTPVTMSPNRLQHQAIHRGGGGDAGGGPVNGETRAWLDASPVGREVL